MKVSPDVFEALPEPVLVVDRTSVLWVSRRAAELAGDPHLAGRALDAVFGAADRERLVRALDDQAVEREGLFRFGFRSELEGFGGLEFRAVDAAEGLLLLVGRDAEHKLAALGQMSALLAHEIRNPLAVMLQAYRQLRRRVGDEAEIDDLMAMLEEEAWRLSRLVDDLLHFAGSAKPQLEDASLSELVSWSLEGLAAEADIALDDFAIHLDVPPELSTVRADPRLLRQAISHLVAAACARLEQGGDLWISAEEDARGHRVRLVVASEGEPLPPDEAARAFEPFFTSYSRGVGLGLAAVKRLVEDQKGRVAVDPTESGVSFSIWLPASARA